MWWQWIVNRWTRTPGYLKWIGGILLGALIRLLLERLFPDVWQSVSHVLFDPKIPVWLAVVAIAVVLMLERTAPTLYRHLHARGEGAPLVTVFGVRWALPPQVEEVQGPYCTLHPVALRGTLWSGDSSPTLWVCPTCGREYSTPEFPDIRREVERRLMGARRPSA
jgi:branched-subunit amino acid ABC-type transport system permease component